MKLSTEDKCRHCWGVLTPEDGYLRCKECNILYLVQMIRHLTVVDEKECPKCHKKHAQFNYYQCVYEKKPGQPGTYADSYDSFVDYHYICYDCGEWFIIRKRMHET